MVATNLPSPKTLSLDMKRNAVFSSYITEKLCFENKLPLFVLFGGLVSFVIFPAHCFLALTTSNIANYMPTGRHVALTWLASLNVHNSMEQVGLAMLAAEILSSHLG